MDTTDITTRELGPHALALREARLQALQAYGLEEKSIMKIQSGETGIAEYHSTDHALMVQSPHELALA